MVDKVVIPVTFTTQAVLAVIDAAGAQGLTFDRYILKAVQTYYEGATPKTFSKVKPVVVTPEPVVETLAQTEQGFVLGVRAACERLAKNLRLSTRMATGLTIGEDIAANIEKDLIG